MFEEADFVLSAAPFPHRTKTGQMQQVQQEGRMSKGGKWCPAMLVTLKCLVGGAQVWSHLNLTRLSKAGGWWLSLRGGGGWCAGPSSRVRQLSLLLRTRGWPLPSVRLGFTAAPKHWACLAHPWCESVYSHLNNLFLKLQLYCLLKGSVRAPEIILVHAHFSPPLGCNSFRFFFFFFRHCYRTKIPSKCFSD